MSKTTPEEAKALAAKYRILMLPHDATALAALIDEVRQEKALEYVLLFGELQNALEEIERLRGLNRDWISESGVKKLMKTEYDRGYAQAKHDQGVDAEPMIRPGWSVRIMEDWNPRRLRLTIGVQSFDLDVQDWPDEPDRMEWFCRQLTGAMEKVTHSAPSQQPKN